MQTADGKPTKTNEEIQAETAQVMATMLPTNSPEVMMLALVYERLGDIWMWAKERR